LPLRKEIYMSWALLILIGVIGFVLALSLAKKAIKVIVFLVLLGVAAAVAYYFAPYAGSLL